MAVGAQNERNPPTIALFRMGIQVSDDTILRQLLGATQENARGARVIGLDDWSWQETQTYGTVIIDSERRMDLDILKDRDVVSCTAW